PQVTVSVPGIKDPNAVESLLVSSGQLQSFDLFRFLDPVSRGPQQYSTAPAGSLYDLLKKVQPKAKADIASGKGVGSWALFDVRHRQLGRVEPQKEQVLQDFNPQNPYPPL